MDAPIPECSEKESQKMRQQRPKNKRKGPNDAKAFTRKTLGKHGEDYNKAVNINCALCATVLEMDFMLSAEENYVGTLDDLCLKYCEENNRKVIGMQIKHFITKGSEVNEQNLRGKYEFLKIFKSYCAVNLNDDETFESVVLYTNEDSDKKFKEKLTKAVSLNEIFKKLFQKGKGEFLVFKDDACAEDVLKLPEEDRKKIKDFDCKRASFIKKAVFAVAQPDTDELDNDTVTHIEGGFNLKKEEAKIVTNGLIDFYLSYSRERRPGEEEVHFITPNIIKGVVLSALCLDSTWKLRKVSGQFCARSNIARLRTGLSVLGSQQPYAVAFRLAETVESLRDGEDLKKILMWGLCVAQEGKAEEHVWEEQRLEEGARILKRAVGEFRDAGELQKFFALAEFTNAINLDAAHRPSERLPEVMSAIARAMRKLRDEALANSAQDVKNKKRVEHVAKEAREWLKEYDAGKMQAVITSTALADEKRLQYLENAHRIAEVAQPPSEAAKKIKNKSIVSDAGFEQLRRGACFAAEVADKLGSAGHLELQQLLVFAHLVAKECQALGVWKLGQLQVTAGSLARGKNVDLAERVKEISQHEKLLELFVFVLLGAAATTGKGGVKQQFQTFASATAHEIQVLQRGRGFLQLLAFTLLVAETVKQLGAKMELKAEQLRDLARLTAQTATQLSWESEELKQCAEFVVRTVKDLVLAWEWRGPLLLMKAEDYVARKDAASACLKAGRGRGGLAATLVVVHSTEAAKLDDLKASLEGLCENNAALRAIVVTSSKEETQGRKEEVCVDQLTEEALRDILEKTVTFQGKKGVIMRDIVGDVAGLKRVLDPNTIEKLVREEHLVVGRELPPPKEPYITRRLQERPEPEKFPAKLKGASQCNVGELDQLGGLDQIISAFGGLDQIRTTFEFFAQLLEDKLAQIITSKRLPASLLNRREPAHLPEDDVVKGAAKTHVVLSAPPGAGKSTLVCSLSSKMKTEWSSHWVAACNLRLHMNTLKRFQDEQPQWATQRKSCQRLLKALFDISESEENFFYEAVYVSGKAVLLFDSYDEVDFEYGEQFRAFLQHLARESKARVWVTTRDLAVEELKAALGVARVFDIAELARSEQEDLLSKLLMKLRVMDAQKTAEDILSELDRRVELYAGSDFFGNPQHLSMIAMVKVSHTTEQVLNMTVHRLYTAFVDVKLDDFATTWYEKDKAKKLFLRDTAPKILKSLKKLACHKFQKPVTDQVQLENVTKELREYNFGIVLNAKENALEFVHQTFAEFFCAHDLYDGIKSLRDDVPFLSWMKFAAEGKNFSGVRRFLEYRLRKEEDYKELPEGGRDIYTSMYYYFTDFFRSRLYGVRRNFLSVPAGEGLAALSVYLWRFRSQLTEDEQHDAFVAAVQSDNVPFVKMALPHVDLDRTYGVEEDTVLHLACRLGRSVETLQLLLKMDGKDQQMDQQESERQLQMLRRENHCGRNAVLCALESGHEDQFKYLLRMEKQLLLKTKQPDFLKVITKYLGDALGAERFPMVNIIVDMSKVADVWDPENPDILSKEHSKLVLEVIGRWVQKLQQHEPTIKDIIKLYQECGRALVEAEGQVRTLWFWMHRLRVVGLTTDLYHRVAHTVDSMREEVRKLGGPPSLGFKDEDLFSCREKVMSDRTCGWLTMDRRSWIGFRWAWHSGTEVVLPMAECALTLSDEKPRQNQDDEVLHALAEWVSATKNGTLKNTRLHEAAKVNDMESCESLISSGCDVDRICIKGMIPLQVATVAGHRDIVKLLIQSGCDVNARCNEGKTALHYAAAGGNRDIVELLIKSGCDVNARCNEGRTLLHYAAAKGNHDIVELLIKSGCDVNASCNAGNTVLHDAALAGHRDIVELLIKSGCDLKARSNIGGTLLHHAAFSGHRDIVELLIKSGCDVNASCNAGNTVLHYAAFSGHRDIVDLLIKSGCDVNARSNEGETPQHIAAGRGHGDIVELLSGAT